MQRNLEHYVSQAKKSFSKRDYEQFVLPIIQLSAENNQKNKALEYQKVLNDYIDKVRLAVQDNKDVLANGDEIILVNTLDTLLDMKKTCFV